MLGMAEYTVVRCSCVYSTHLKERKNGKERLEGMEAGAVVESARHEVWVWD